MNQGSLRSTITIKIKLPVPLDLPFETPVSTDTGERFLKSGNSLRHYMYPFVEDLNEYYTKVLTWIKANPSDQQVVTAIKKLYAFKERQPNEPDIWKNVNTKLGHETFMKKLLDHETKTIFLIGPRGSGKTFYLNFVMNTQTDNLYKQHMTIYRAELSKLYNFNIVRTVKREALLSLMHYFYMHIAYVTYGHKDRTPLWEDILQNKENILVNAIVAVIANKGDNAADDEASFVTRPEKMVSLYEDLLRAVGWIRLGSKAAKDLIFDIFEQKLGKELSCDLAEAILHITYKKRFRPILIFDGLDNIEYDRYPELYDNMIADLTEVCFRKDDLCHKFDAKVVISLRDETFEHIKKLRKDYIHRSSEFFYLKHHDLKSIMSLKSLHASGRTTKYFSKQKPKPLDFKKSLQNLPKEEGSAFPIRTASQYDSLFAEFAETYIDRLVDSNRAFLSAAPSYPDDTPKETILFETLYNHNLRQFLHNFVNVFRYAMLFQLRKNVVGNRKYVLTEGQLLNGTIYLKSGQKPDFGACIPNIFWFDARGAGKKWHGLCLYRLLQVLHIRHLSRQDVFEQLQRIFGYDVRIIAERFDTAVTYGLVTCWLDESSNLIRYKPTSKGDIFLHYPFLDIDQFYYMALDTPVCAEANRNSAMVRFHVNGKSAFWQNYTEACILTSITVLRHIWWQHQLEAKAQPEVAKNFPLPDTFPDDLIGGMLRHLARLQKINRRRFDELILTVEGLKCFEIS